VRPWSGWDTRVRVPWPPRRRFLVIAVGLTPSTATAEHLQALAASFEQEHGALSWAGIGPIIPTRAD